jgi:putative ABC transport system permease protein
MAPFHRFVRPLRTLFGKSRLERDMAEEMRFHLEQRTADQAADGLSADEARYAAQRKFGNLASIQEQSRDSRGWRGLENFVKDLGLAARSLLKSPGFTLIAIVTLGLGIGANTAMFSILNTILLKPLPYAGRAQLDRIYRATAQNPEGNVSPADFFDLQRASEGYGEVAAYRVNEASLAEPGHPAEIANAARSSVNLFALLGAQPQLGRDFRAGEDLPGRDRVVILSQRTWRNRFGGSAGIIGHTIRIDGEPHQVIGVMPATFNDWRHLGWVDFFRPLAFTPEQAADRTDTMLRVDGRRDPARSEAEAAGFITSFGARQAAAYPVANAETTWCTVPLQLSASGRGSVTIVPMLIGLSGFVLLIACSNLANLLLARTMARAREFAVRAALGASRIQLLRPLVAEALVLSLAGGACALLAARWFGDYLAMRSTGDNGEQVIFTLNWLVAGWAFTASLVTALAFGLAPALFALRLDLNRTLKSGGRGTTGGRGHQRFRQFLIIGQFALAMALLAGAGLFIRGVYDLNNRRAGWTSDQLLTGTILLPAAHYGDAEKITAFHRLALQRLTALPGVAAASIASFTPFFNWPDSRKFLAEGRERPAPGHEPAALVNRVSPAYFDTVGTRVLAGRAFTERDRATAPRVYILSEGTARALFGDENPLGRRLAPAGPDDPQWGEVVGVARDVQPVVAEVNPVVNQVYQPMAQAPGRTNEILVRTTGVAAGPVIDAIRATMTELDPDLPVRKLQAADATINRANYQLGVLRDMLTMFAVLGLGLASVGVYGVIARTMAQRTGEFAIRLALGASIRDITRIVLASGVKLALAGSLFGLLGAFGISRILTSNFPGIRAGNVAILAGASLLLVGVALVACWLPARRAAKVDAMTALRAE